MATSFVAYLPYQVISLWQINIIHGSAIWAWEAWALQELSCRIRSWSIREQSLEVEADRRVEKQL